MKLYSIVNITGEGPFEITQSFFNISWNIYPGGSKGAIESNMATTCFYEFMSALKSVKSLRDTSETVLQYSSFGDVI